MIIVNDDVVYSNTLVKQLTIDADVNSGAIVCLRAHLPCAPLTALFYSTAHGYSSFGTTSPVSRHLSTYRPVLGECYTLQAFLHADVMDMETALRICRTADDVCFCRVGRRAHTVQLEVGGTNAYMHTHGSQTTGLLRDNCDGANDRQIKAIWETHGRPQGIPDPFQPAPEFG